MGKVHVAIEDVSKRFGEFEAVKHLTLGIDHGSFVTLLGPSGCGKTTTLRMLAGFFDPDDGTIRFDDIPQRGIPPERRETSIVFQEYALFPHMSVFDNVSYGLRIRHLPRQEVRRRTEETLRQVGLQELERRFPYELSGGQQQRVALARSLIMQPRILLMDEPLSNLDAKLRGTVRDEIKQLQSQLKITTIYVTHDQEEALALSDTIAVMNEGMLRQVGTASDLYNRPADPWVAGFVGMANLIAGVVGERSPRGVAVQIGSAQLVFGHEAIDPHGPPVEAGRRLQILIRPEWAVVRKGPAGPAGAEARLVGTVVTQAYLGSFVRYGVRVPGLERPFIVDDHQCRVNGVLTGEVCVGLAASDAYVFPDSVR